MDLLQHMATFVRIADTGSISKAARAQHLSVAMTSRHLRALEEHLGVELVRRTTRNLALTEAGNELLARARTILAEVDEARAVVRPGRGAAGLVVVSLPVAFGLGQLAPLFHAILDRHPRLRLDLRFEDHLVNLLGDGIDVAIRAGAAPPDSTSVIARHLATVERVLCASPELVARHRITSMESLQHVPCLVHGEPPTRWRYETADGERHVTVDGRVRTSNALALRDAAVAGYGVAQLTSWLVADDVKKKRLVRVLPDVRLPDVQVYGLYHRGARGMPAIRAVLDHFEAMLQARVDRPRT